MNDPAVHGPTIARAYVERVNAADADGLLDLFADDAVLVHPVGTFEGRDAIRSFYEDLVFAGQAVVTLGRVAQHDDVVFFELTATSALDPGGTVIATVDVADVDARGRLIGLAVYSR